MMELKGKKVLVVGLGKSGLAAALFLRRRGAYVTVSDVRSAETLANDIPALLDEGIMVETGGHGLLTFRRQDLIVVSPGVPLDTPELAQVRSFGLPVIGELELAARFLKGRTVAITGSNGKTTTTSLIGHILREAGLEVQVGGNIGTPVTAMIASSRADGWNVLELSSFQLETIAAFRADIGLALNVTQNHLDRHRTFENYAAAKRRLFETMSADGCAVLNAEDPICASFAQHTAAAVRWFSGARPVEAGAYRLGGDLILDGRRLMSAGEIPLRGNHNVENVLAAAVAASRAGVSDAKIAAAVKTFRAVEHRLEFVRNVTGVDFYNDSKATSVDATLKAIDAFPGGLWIILGGKDKDSDFTALREPLRAKARAALLIGAAAPKIARQLGDDTLPVIQCGTLAAAIDKASRSAVPGHTVLLAPACASFDQFDNFEHRGRVFKDLVNALAKGNR
jgi:UDP-N-acetylmuramoylalanine--D-glutamate ligase